jgi:hypothetical protein
MLQNWRKIGGSHSTRSPSQRVGSGSIATGDVSEVSIEGDNKVNAR